MSVNIFGSSGKHASGVNGNVGFGGVDRNFNQRLIMLSNKLAQKINKSGDTMEGDLKFVYKPESTCKSLSLGVEGMDKKSQHVAIIRQHTKSNISCRWIAC